MNIPKIEVKEFWSRNSVRETCIRNQLYTRGSGESYANMLDVVERFNPSPYRLYIVARDIVKHSEEQTITNVMFILPNEAVKRTYTINGSDEV